MAINYEWNCKSVEVYFEYEGEADVVYVIQYKLDATSSETHEVDGEDVPYTASRNGSIRLTLGDLSDFIPFADLTNEDTTGWVEDTMGEDFDGITTTNFTELDKTAWSLADLLALCPISQWDDVFDSQYDSVITNPPEVCTPDNDFVVPE